jgi:hypothetical protein
MILGTTRTGEFMSMQDNQCHDPGMHEHEQNARCRLTSQSRVAIYSE